MANNEEDPELQECVKRVAKDTEDVFRSAFAQLPKPANPAARKAIFNAAREAALLIQDLFGIISNQADVQAKKKFRMRSTEQLFSLAVPLSSCLM